MCSHDAAHQQPGTGRNVIAIRPRARIVESLRAVGLNVELRLIGRHVVPIVTMERPNS